MSTADDEDKLLRSVALQNAQSILLARQRAEEDLIRAKEELRESAERLQLALLAGDLGDWSWDAKRDVMTLSPRAAEIFGLPQTPITWARAREILHEDDRERSRLAAEQALANRTVYSIEYRVVHASGGQRWLATKGRGTYAADGTVLGMTGVVQDITEREQLLARERAARAQAERISALKDEFLANLSHELRTPLTAILGWTQVLRRRPAAETAGIRDGLEIIERNTRLQAQLIEDLLDMSRIDSGKMRIDVQPVQPALVVETALETIKPAADAKNIRLEKLLDPAAGPISGDPNRLQQIMWNLLSNAIKFTPKDGKVQVLLERVNSHIELSVADNGIGIEAEFLSNVFERFRQADASTTRRYSGLGLGLSIVKHLVELHGGTVRAESAGLNQGATFTIHLPLIVVQRRTADSARRHPTTPIVESSDFITPDLSGITVLVVDDERDARDLIKQVLVDCGADVLTAGGADEALALLQKHTPTVLVSDIGMPNVDGYELLKRVRALKQPAGRRIPAIALTAFARSEDRTRALHAGFLVHVAKPVEANELLASVASVAGRAPGTPRE